MGDLLEAHLCGLALDGALGWVISVPKDLFVNRDVVGDNAPLGGI